jgi:hypothetical protein
MDLGHAGESAGLHRKNRRAKFFGADLVVESK